jgi:hypothetical protein
VCPEVRYKVLMYLHFRVRRGINGDSIFARAGIVETCDESDVWSKSSLMQRHIWSEKRLDM